LVGSGTSESFEIGKPTSKASLSGKKGRIKHPSVFPIDFEESNEKFDLIEFYSRLVKDFDPQQAFDLPCHDDLKYEIARCMQALIYWEWSPGDKLYGKEDILKGTLLHGSEFTNRLKDEWEYGLRHFHQVFVLGRSYSTWKEVRHYNAIPPVQYLINWRETPDDYKYMFIPVSDLSLIGEFKDTLESFLTEDFEMPTEHDITSITKVSVSLDLSARKKIPFYAARLSPLGTRFSRVFKGQRTLVPVGAGNTRDTVVTTIDTFNTISMIDKIILRILNNVDESLVNESPSKFNDKLRRASRKSPGWIYYLRDIKKCGLTFPRELFLAVQEVLSEVYPEKDFSYFDIFRNYSIYMENWKPMQETNRGYCLGMANNLVTLCQCVIFEMIQRRCPDVELQGFFGNDDSIISFEQRLCSDIESNCALIEDTDDIVLRGLSVIKNPDKSFWSVWPIIFEEYGKEEFQGKESRLAMALSAAKLAPDIRFAKCVVNALSPLFQGKDYERRILSDIIYHWGYEFFPEEVDYSYSIGGWYTHLSHGCDLSLRETYDIDDPELIRNIYMAKESIDSWYSAIGRTPQSSKEVGKSYSPIGLTYKVWVLDPDFETTILPYSSINMSKEDYKKFQAGLFDLSRNLTKGMKIALKHYHRSYIPKDSVSIYDLRRLILSSKLTLAIPEEIVTTQSVSYTEDYVDPPEPNPVLKRSIALRELLAQDKKIRIELDNYPDYPPTLAGAEVEELPRTRKPPFRIVHEKGKIDKSIFQFSSNPHIPLMEYIRRYDFCPESTYQYVDTGDREQNWAIHKYDIRNGQEFRWFQSMRGIIPDEHIDDLLSEMRERHKEEMITEDDKSKIIICDSHQISLTAGLDQDLSIINIIEDDCHLCKQFHEFFRVKYLKDHDDDLEKREFFNSIFPMVRTRLKEVIASLGHNSDEVWALQEGETDFMNASLADSDEESGGLFSMFE
jgi:hypothetical protein